MKTSPAVLTNLKLSLATEARGGCVTLPVALVADLLDDVRDLLTERETTRVEVAELIERSRRLVHTLEEMKLIMMRGDE